MQPLLIKRMQLEDIDEVYEIELASYPSPWSKQTFYNEITHNKNAYYLVAKRNNKIIGYAGMHIILDEAHLTNITTHPAYRQKGIAKILLLELLEEAMRNNANVMTLEVRETNKIAQQLYAKFQFRKVAVRKNYYVDTNEPAQIWYSPNLKKQKFREWLNDYKTELSKTINWQVIKNIEVIV